MVTVLLISNTLRREYEKIRMKINLPIPIWFNDDLSTQFTKKLALVLVVLIGYLVIGYGQKSKHAIMIPDKWKVQSELQVVAIKDAKRDTFDNVRKVPAEINIAYASLGKQSFAVERNLKIGEDILSLNNEFKAIPVRIFAKDTDKKRVPLFLVYFVEKAMTFNKSSRLFEGAVNFYLQKEKDDGQGMELIEPIAMDIRAEDVEGISPKSIKLKQVNEMRSVQIVDDYPVDSVVVRFISDFIKGENYSKTSIPVKPRLSFQEEKMTIQGWGLGKVKVPLTIDGKSGDFSKNVTLNAIEGIVKPQQLTLNAQSPQILDFYSKGLKGGKLEAKMSNAEPVVLLFDYYFPWEFFIASILGGLVGAFIYTWRNNQDRSKSKKDSWTKNITISVLWGLLCAVAYILGINLIGPIIPLDLPLNEATIFLIASLGGAFLSYIFGHKKEGQTG